MTISSTTRKAGPFIGNGSASSFPFTFKVFQASDLLVVQLDTTFDVESTLVLNTNYTVTLNTNQNTNPGGTVTLSAGALAAGYTLTITSDIDNLQPTDLTNQGGFYPTVINDALDRATIQIQQLQVESDRSIKVPVSSTVGTNLPTPQANDLIGWNGDASALVNVDPGTLATVAAYATAYADTFTTDGSTVNWTLTRDPATINNLDVSIDGVTQVPNVDYTLSGTTFSTTSTVPSGRVILVKYREGLPNMSADSQDVRYVPAGTGAVTTTVQAKLRETVSVKDFGAVGDGVADDSAAIQAAINTGESIYFPDGTFKIDSSIIIDVSDVIIYGAGRDQSIIQASGAFPVFKFGNDPSVTNISNFVLKNIAVRNGTYGLYAARNAGSFLTLERFFIDDVSIASQSTAGLYFTGSQLGYFVNNITNTAFRYCGRGFVLDDVFSANLNHINLCRFEGNAGHGIKVSTTNQECSLLTIEKCRFEAITTEAAINITSGTQALSVKENYFEDCPAGVMEFDADAGLNISTLIESNNVSSNAIPVNVITFSSQCINTSIVNNTFRQGAGPATITGGAFCTGFNVYGNGAINFVGFPTTIGTFLYYDQEPPLTRVDTTKNHAGTFTYDFTLPKQGMYDLQMMLLDDGDITIGAIAYFAVTWINGAIPILDAYVIRKVVSAETTDIAATVDTAGKVTVTFTKSGATPRLAYINYSYSNLVVTP